MSERVRAAPEQTFTNEEVGKILKRAAGLQRELGPPAATLTRSELEQIAIDAGIDPAQVRQAIGELRQPPGSRAQTWFGAPTRVSIERIIPGELDPKHHEALAQAIRQQLQGRGGPGLVSTVGRTLTYVIANQKAPVEISFSVSGGNTVLRLEANFSQLAGGVFGGIVGGVGGSAGPNIAWILPFMGLTSLPVGIAAGLGVVGLTWLACRPLYRALVGGQQRKLATLADQLEQQLRALLPA
ncbi:MAG: hypothetical protein H6Q89_4288 [Myxococcaceae bacterium]|nr:hypothetical protein [Myxococcaceae bacterium]